MKPACSECNDTGKYKIYNAYDPDYVEEIECEYCGAEETVDKTTPIWMN